MPAEVGTWNFLFWGTSKKNFEEFPQFMSLVPCALFSPQVARLVRSIKEVATFFHSWTDLADQLANALMEEEELMM